ncbi:peptide chain release factor N(5)-glutamine methyltransferase [Aliikangiella sp. IMCC44653]
MEAANMTVSEALDYALQILPKATDLEQQDSRTDAEYLLAEALQRSFTWLKTWPDYSLSPAQVSQFKMMLNRRVQGEPIAYIIGHRDFWNLTLKTNPSTLIPRSDTELLVEIGLALLASYQQANVLDLGTGTGAIALALASERSSDRLFACDVNSAAVALAQENQKLNQLSNVQFFQSDWFTQVNEHSAGSKFQLIVSNPPYIDPKDPHLTQGDLVFEPNSALIADKQGLADIQVILQQAPKFLVDGGFIALEHGYNQGEAVRELMSRFNYSNIETRQDLAGLDRVSLARFDLS